MHRPLETLPTRHRLKLLLALAGCSLPARAAAQPGPASAADTPGEPPTPAVYEAIRPALAARYGGQFIWVHPPLELVVAVTSTVSDDGARRGQALTLIRQDLFRAALAFANGR